MCQLGRPAPARSSPKRRSRYALTIEGFEDRIVPATLTVNSVADTITAGSVLTLRQAILVVDGTLGRSLTTAEQRKSAGRWGITTPSNSTCLQAPQTISLTACPLSITSP